MMSIPLFTLVFLVFLTGSGAKVATVHAKEAVPAEVCQQNAQAYQDMVVNEFVQNRGMKVFVVSMCVPEERRA